MSNKDTALIFFVASGTAFKTFFPFLNNTSWLPLFSSLEQAANSVSEQGGDWGNYLIAADKMFSSDRLDLTAFGIWQFNLWPPGQPALFALIDQIVQESNLFVIAYLAVIVLTWTYASALTIRTLKKGQTKVLFTLTLIALIFFSPFGDWLFGPTVFYAEASSIGFFYTSLLLLLRSFLGHRKSKVLANSLGSASFMTMAAYVRSAFDFAGFALIVILVFFLILESLSTKHTNPLFPRRPMMLEITGSWVLTFTILTLPWRLYLLGAERSSYLFASASGRVVHNAWVPTKYWQDPYFPEVAGINWLCQSYSDRCAELESAEALSDAPYSGQVFSPEDFLSFALEELIKNPFPALINRVDFATQSFGLAVTGQPSQLFSALALSATLLVAFFSISKKSAFVAVRFWVSSVLVVSFATVAPLVVSSWEARYWFPAILGLLLTVAVSMDMPGSVPLYHHGLPISHPRGADQKRLPRNRRTEG